jgi:hypothetical protein
MSAHGTIRYGKTLRYLEKKAILVYDSIILLLSNLQAKF